MGRHKLLKEGKWVAPVHRGYLLECCDCGLIHRMDFKIGTVDGKPGVMFRAWRHNRIYGRASPSKPKK